MGLFDDYKWNTSEWDSIGDVPILGDVHKGIFGDPEAIKAAYDKAIGLSQKGSKDIKDFLMGQQGKAQQYYAPLANLFQSTYGTQGIQSPQIPQATGPGTLSALYGGR